MFLFVCLSPGADWLPQEELRLNGAAWNALLFSSLCSSSLLVA